MAIPIRLLTDLHDVENPHLNLNTNYISLIRLFRQQLTKFQMSNKKIHYFFLLP